MAPLKREIHHYTLPLTNGEKRSGLLVELTAPDGRTSWGEVAPLPGWSLETLEEAYAELLKEKESLMPSVAFGLETAELGCTRPSLPLTFPISSLLFGTVKQIMEKADRCAKSGIKSVKVKLSALSDEEALFVVSHLKSKFSLRLDLNRAWPLKRSLNFFSHFLPHEIDYVEEPCSLVEDLYKFPFPLAVDESLRDTSLDLLLEIPHLKALIFKPTLQGGLKAGKLLTEAAMKRGVDLIFSSAYESGVGITQIALLAHALNAPIKPLGIDTYSLLAHDVLNAPIEISEGYLHLNDHFQVNKKLLGSKEHFHGISS